jgi:hypothetical protein
MVTEKSATSTGITAAADEDNIGLDVDHSGLVKFSARSQEPYRIVIGRITELASHGISEISRRFADSTST